MVNIQAKTPNDGHQAAHEVVLYIYTGWHEIFMHF
jgi:hypothetical protein